MAKLTHIHKIHNLIIIITTTMMMNSCKGQTIDPVVRPATQAGLFYEADPRMLSHEVDSLLALHAKDSVYEKIGRAHV